MTLSRSLQSLATPQVAVSMTLTRTPRERAAQSIIAPLTLSRQLSYNFKLEKPKLPKFTGDVREYAIFRSDWKHIVDTRYAKRDAITLLCANLSDKPLKLIKGIGTDYDAAWQYLDAIYGDPRYVSDSVTQDISKFKPLQDGEDSRFCDLVHLVRRSYNTLKEVGVPGDMDNSHMLAIIERKMGPDDKKVGSRDLEQLSWMTSEMKSRMRATAPARSGSSQRSINRDLRKPRRPAKIAV